jgi:hypothetical protein
MQLRKLIAPVAILISLLLYWKSSNYGLVTDYMGWLNKYRAGDWTDIIHCFNYLGLHQFFHLINYTIYKLTLGNTFGLYLIFAITHGLVSYAVYRSLRVFTEWLEWEQGSLVAFFTAILFLVSPYQIETLTWKACYHYMMVTGLGAMSWIYMIRFFQSDNRKYLILHLVWFVLALFTLEIALVIPGIFGISYLFKAYMDIDRVVLMRGVRISVIHAIFLVGFFILTKMVIGDFVGHYGAEKHMVFTPALILGGAAKYLMKYTFFTHYYPFQVRYDLYEALSVLKWAAVVLIPFIAIWVYGIKNCRTQKNWTGVSFGVASFIIGVLPVLNLYFMNIHPYENDRYGYYASQFLYFGMISLLFILFKNYKYSFSILLILVALIFNRKTMRDVYVAGEVIQCLVDDFRWYDQEHIVVTGLPENMNGAYMFRDFSEAGVALKECLDWQGNEIYEGNIKVLSNFNIKNDQSHLTAKLIGKDTLEVWDIMPGSWFWRKGVGMNSYHKNGVKVEMKDSHFIATFDDPHPGVIYITPEGKRWREVKYEGQE